MLIIAWEVTSACNLRCSYCRATAESSPSSGELSTAEALSFIDQISGLRPMLILSGGEPLLRADIYRLARHASKAGLRVSLATNGTLLNPENVAELSQAGVRRVSVSLDGANAEINDLTRGEGSFKMALKGIEALRGNLDFQINMTLTRKNYHQLPNLVRLAEDLGSKAIHFFFLVPTGRGREEDMLPTREQMQLLRSINRLSTSLEIQATCAPFYARLLELEPVPGRQSGGCMAGRSFAFVSRVGDVYPCGYLPLRAGNVREQPFPEIWQTSSLLTTLRRRELKGSCGSCDYRSLCGGCRARAYALSGDVAGEDPACPFVPASG